MLLARLPGQPAPVRPARARACPTTSGGVRLPRLGGPTSPSATRIPPATRLATSTPSSRTCQLASVVLVAHDASGPPVIDRAPEPRSGSWGLVVLNTYYCRMPKRLRPRRRPGCSPPPTVRRVARTVSMCFGGRCFAACTGGRWGGSSGTRGSRLAHTAAYEQCTVSPAAHEAFFGLNRDPRHRPDARTAEIPRLRRFTRVRIVFGAADPYLNRRVADPRSRQAGTRPR